MRGPEHVKCGYIAAKQFLQGNLGIGPPIAYLHYEVY